MSRVSWIRRVVTWVLVVVMCVGSPSLLAPLLAQSTRLVHTPITGFVPAFRINVTTMVVDSSGVGLVRCYFRARGEANFVFVDMVSKGGNDYLGVLPAPSAATESIEYVLLAVTGAQRVVRSQTFVMTRQQGSQPTAWQTTNTNGSVSVSTELAQAPQTVAGFTDSIAMDVVESAFRFGYVVENLYVVSQMAGPAPVGYQGSVSLATSGTAPTPYSQSPATQRPVAQSSTAATTGGGSSAWPWIILGGLVVGGGGAVAYKVLNKEEPEVLVSFRVGTWYGSQRFEVSIDGTVMVTTPAGNYSTISTKLKGGTSHTLSARCISGGYGEFCYYGEGGSNLIHKDTYVSTGGTLSFPFVVNSPPKK